MLFRSLNGKCEKIRFVVDWFMKQMLDHQKSNLPPSLVKKYIKFKMQQHKMVAYAANKSEL